MIEFVTLFLGLVLGQQRIEVSVDDSVASVELRLDGETLGVIEGEPWTWSGTLGAELIPHELVAIARDPSGRQVARARQWINMPSRRAEARLALERQGKTTIARLVWQALDFDQPRAIDLTFDGQPLQVDDPGHIELPRHDRRQLHFLRAVVEFSDTVHAQAELVFGGTYGEEVRSELTAILVETDRKRLPEPAQLQGWFSKAGEPLRVAAIERGPADVLVVRERSEVLWSLVEDLLRQQSGAATDTTRRLGRGIRTVNPELAQGRVLMPWTFTPDDRVRFVFPRTEARQGSRFAVHLLPVSKNLVRFGGGSLLGILGEVRFDEDLELSPELPLADAVAIAGITAAASNRRRAVVLVRSGATADSGRLDSDQVRAYLRELQVPLMHWTLDRGVEDVQGWGEGEPIAKLARFKQVLKAFHQRLERQAVVWLEGSHVPRDIELSPQAVGLRLLEISADDRAAAKARGREPQR